LRAADLWIFLIVGFAGAFCQFFYNQAFRYGEVSMLAPLEYTALVWGIIYGLLLWNEFPSLLVLAGAAVVAGSSLYIVRREARLARTADTIKDPAGPAMS
jgi:drug/metabolite transporter (DMT)-like permease